MSAIVEVRPPVASPGGGPARRVVPGSRRAARTGPTGVAPRPAMLRTLPYSLWFAAAALLAPVPADAASLVPTIVAPGSSGLWIDRPLLAVEIEGLRRTRPLVVLRELSARVGAPLDWNRLERDRMRLLDLGLFASVAFVPRRDRDRDGPILDRPRA